MDMLTWDHDGGLSLDAKVRTEAAERAGLVRLIRCCLVPPIALDRSGSRSRFSPPNNPHGLGSRVRGTTTPSPEDDFDQTCDA
jgi:hypothetical protein